jgi:hypothetical protein
MSLRTTLSTVVLVLAACVTTSINAFAEDTPARVRGTLQKMDGNNLTIATKSGKEANVPLKDGAPIIAVTKGAAAEPSRHHLGECFAGLRSGKLQPGDVRDRGIRQHGPADRHP